MSTPHTMLLRGKRDNAAVALDASKAAHAIRASTPSKKSKSDPGPALGKPTPIQAHQDLKGQSEKPSPRPLQREPTQVIDHVTDHYRLTDHRGARGKSESGTRTLGQSTEVYSPTAVGSFATDKTVDVREYPGLQRVPTEVIHHKTNEYSLAECRVTPRKT
ncbi:hypothetical protein PENSPDRAFT_670285 [Peniophora sp. CONT]|nr:hypothetical protein PENSPDRAFT_670285 [Peniophora sp. CONT]